MTTQKSKKPIYECLLYRVVKMGARYAVVLRSKPEMVLYTGMKMYAVEWAQENGLGNALEGV